MTRRHTFRSLLLLALAGFVLYLAITTSDFRERELNTVEDKVAPRTAAEVLHAQIDHVFDGDTVSVRLGERIERVRLAGIDAPERGQPFADEARDYLRLRCAGRSVEVMVLGRDRFDRLLADLYCGPSWLNGELVAGGYAWNWSRGHRSEELAQRQRQAQQERLGLWADDAAQAPWEFRRDNANTAANRSPPGTRRRPGG